MDTPPAHALGKRKLRVLLLSSDTGGGHRASALALRAALERLLPGEVKVDIVDFWVQLAGGPFSNFPAQYAFLAKHPLLWKLTYELTRFPPARAFTETLFNAVAHRKIRDAFKEHAPDLIISVHPLVNTLSLRVLKRMREETGIPTVPYVTVVTDLGGAHPTWFVRNADMIYVPSEPVRKIAIKCGILPAKVKQFGLPLRSAFWTEPDCGKREMKESLGLSVDVPAVLIVGGGDGVGKLGKVAMEIAKRVRGECGEEGAQLVVICGKNASLKEELKNKNWPVQVHVLGFVNNMSDWMTACDILCTKAGPGTIAEALVRGLPILLTSFLPGQEEPNVRFVLDNNVGAYATRPKKIAALITKWLKNPLLLTEMANKACAISTPHSTESIAKDIIVVTQRKRAQNDQEVKRQMRVRDAQAAIARAELRRLSSVRSSRSLPDANTRSHLLFHIKRVLQIVTASVLAHDALAFTPPAMRTNRVLLRDAQPRGEEEARRERQ